MSFVFLTLKWITLNLMTQVVHFCSRHIASNNALYISVPGMQPTYHLVHFCSRLAAKTNPYTFLFKHAANTITGTFLFKAYSQNKSLYFLFKHAVNTIPYTFLSQPCSQYNTLYFSVPGMQPVQYLILFCSGITANIIPCTFPFQV